MSQVHRPQRATGPGLGSVLVYTAVSLGALVALGVAIYAWNSPDTSIATNDPGRETSATDVPTRRDATGEATNGRPVASTNLSGVSRGSRGGSGTDVASSGPGSDASAVRGSDSALRAVDSGRLPLESMASAEPSAGFVVEQPDDVEDLSDIERPVAYADAEAYFRAREYGEASRHFAAYVEDHGENAWGFYMLGLSRMRAGRADAAESAFLGALDIDPDHAKSLVNLARVRMDLGRFGDALVPIERATQLVPGDNAVLRVHARVLHNLGRVDEAAEIYLSALALDAKDVWAMNNLGLIRIEQEEFSEAVPPLARAVELDSTVAVFQNNLGIALERIGDYSGAVQAYRDATHFDESYGRAQGNLDRAEPLLPTQSRESLDLAVYAAEFASEISGDQVTHLGAPGPISPVSSGTVGLNMEASAASLSEKAVRK